MQELGLGPNPTRGGPNRTLSELGRRRLVGTATQAAPGLCAHKWKSFRHLCVARREFGVSDRTLAVLEALLTFHPETVLTVGSDAPVVFPSNRQLSIRARGMAASTLRRHLAVLTRRGLLLRRDSSNGKRFAWRDPSGDIDEAFGFDLGPFVARAEEFERAAEHEEARRRQVAGLRAKIAITRRDIAKMIAAGAEASATFDWAALHRRLQGLAVPSRRAQDTGILEVALIELTQLEAECLTVLQAALSKDELSELHAASEGFPSPDARPSDPEADVQPDYGETNGFAAAKADPVAIRGSLDDSPDPLSNGEGGSSNSAPTTAKPPTSGVSRVPLALVLATCSDIRDYTRSEIHTFPDLCAAADLVRTLLGVTPDAWREACRVMGREGAAIIIAAILQRGDAIKNPGGYLRCLTRRAAANRFSVWPMLMALDAARRRASVFEGVHAPAPGGSRPTALRCS
jgi:replication initiation protein RepC